MTDDLVTWFRQQLDEDERLAQAAGGTSWVARGHLAHVSTWSRGVQAKWCEILAEVEYVGPTAQTESMDHAAHIVRHDPARVLAEVAAKRAVIDLLEELNELGLYEAVQFLALPYADRPGYREEWKP